MVQSSRSVLVTGATGFLGRYVVAVLGERGVDVVRAGRRDGADVPMDLARPDAVRDAVEAARPDLVLHCAAMSSIGACDADPELAGRVNAESVHVLATGARRLLFVSTDLVFDGSSAPYRAVDPPAPLQTYGETKAAAEGVVFDAGGLVVRLPLLFGPSHDGRTGATDMIRADRDGALTLYTDEIRTPLHVADAAEVLVDLLLTEDRSGVLHVAGPERVSRHELGLRFARIAGLPTDRFAAGTCPDPQRPRDVSLVSDVPASRGLDDALRAS